MKTYKILLSFFIAIIFISSCRKDSMITEKEMTPPLPEINIEATINGFVTDKNGAPIPEATVTVLNNYTTTDQFGFFEITGLVNKKIAVVSIEKSGYFKQIKSLVPSETAKSRTRIQLIEKGFPEIVSSSTGGEITVTQGTTVQFQPNSFVDDQGNPYNGDVNIYSFYIDPTDPELDLYMPGNLMANNTNNELRILQSFGMVNVELESSGGQKLNINKNATLTLQVPQSISNNAPTEIPLWYFDEEKGLWIEEGSAQYQNGTYVGEVAHFTFWNCDVPFETTQITGSVFDNKGISIVKIRITDLSTGVSYSEWIDDAGNFSGFVPQNTNLLFEILGICGIEVLFSSNIGPFTEEMVDLGVFNISGTTSFAQISGSLIGCDQAPVTNGLIIFNIPANNFYQQTMTDASGNFSALVPTCDLAEIEIRGYDLTTDLVSDIEVFTSAPTINTGPIETCINVSPTLGSVTINANGIQKDFDNCIVSIPSPGGNNSYTFTYYEDLGNGDTVFYNLNIVDLNNDLNNPIWGQSFFFFSPPANASSLTYSGYNNVNITSSASITVDQANSNPGEILQLTIDNCTINVREYLSSGADILYTYPNSNISLSGVIQ